MLDLGISSHRVVTWKKKMLYTLTLKPEYSAQEVKFYKFFSTYKSISRTIGPKLGLFVLSWMHFYAKFNFGYDFFFLILVWKIHLHLKFTCRGLNIVFDAKYGWLNNLFIVALEI